MVIHSSFADFILFIYVHMSEVDQHYDPSEMDVIQKKMARLFPEEADFEKKLYATIKEYNAFDKEALHDLFVDSFRHFVKDEFKERHKVYSDLQEIMLADGKVESSEAQTLHLLREIIDLDLAKKT